MKVVDSMQNYCNNKQVDILGPLAVSGRTVERIHKNHSDL